MWKPRWSHFYRTPLDSHLQDLGIDTVVMAGCNFPNCPRTTIFDASERDYRVVIAHDAAPAEDGGTRLWLPMLDGTVRVGVLGVTVQDVDDLLRHTPGAWPG